MIGTLILLCTLWPIGLYMLIKKIRRGRGDSKKLRSMGLSAMLCGLVACVLGLPHWGGPMLLAGAGVTFFGRMDQKRKRRYRKYLAVIGGRSPVSLNELASRVGEPLSTVEHDLQAMIDAGYFGLDTYVDVKRHCIVLDGIDNEGRDAYDEAPGTDRVSKIERDIRGAVNRIFDDIKQGIGETKDALSGQREAKEPVIDESSKVRVNVKDNVYLTWNPAEDARGRQDTKAAKGEKGKKSAGEPAPADVPQDQYGHYITEIRDANGRIADEEISGKIDRIENITAKIFAIVRKKPEREGEIRKFMNYYLPTTLKLLDSYALLEEQGIEGENISASKKQISEILDTLIKSYEKQLDQLFTASAMDISSDIQVMETMLSSDGLKDSDFELKPQARGGH